MSEPEILSRRAGEPRSAGAPGRTGAPGLYHSSATAPRRPVERADRRGCEDATARGGAAQSGQERRTTGSGAGDRPVPSLHLGLSPDEALARAKSTAPEEKKLLENFAGWGWALFSSIHSSRPKFRQRCT